MKQRIVQQAGIAAHMAFYRNLGKSYLASCEEIEQQMRSEANGMLKTVVLLHKSADGVRTHDTTNQCLAITNQYNGNFKAMQHCLHAVEEVYVVECEKEDVYFRTRFGSEAVHAVQAEKTGWLTSMVSIHKQQTSSTRLRRHELEQMVKRLIDKLVIVEAI